MGNIESIFGGPFIPPSQRQLEPPEVQLRDAMEAAGLRPPAKIIMDGKLHRFDADAKGGKTGWLVAWPDGVPAGRFGCWRADIDRAWRADVGREMSFAEQMAHSKRMAEIAKARDEAKAKAQEVVADVVADIWAGAAPADAEHPYLKAKGVQPHGARVIKDGRLIVPLFTPEGMLSSVQYIDGDGVKRFHLSGQTKGCLWTIGEAEQPGPFFIAEGFATAASIHEETGRQCVVAFSASNMPSVAQTLRAKHGPARELVIVADNDAKGMGRKYADEAASLTGARVVMPPTPGQDANDYRAAGGDLRALLEAANARELATRGGLALIDVGAWHGQPVPERDWIVPDWLMPRCVTLLAGGGGVGKSLFIQQWLSAIALGADFVGLRSNEPLPVLYLNCEDEADELHRRQAAIATALNCQMNDFAGKVHLAARAGMENILGHVDKESGRFEAHGLFHDIYKAACDMEAKVIALDNAMQLYHGNLNDPGEVTRFLNALDGLSKDTGAAVIVAGHIAKTTGSQFSGTMAWENAVRMRHFLSRPTDEQGNEIEATDSRILSRGKANAARKGERLEFSWYKGAFYSSVHIDMNSLSAGIDARADNAFLACLDRKTEKEVHVSNSSASPSNFAPKIFEKMAEADGFNRKQLEAAMWRLLKDGVIEENRELPWKTSHRKPAKGLARSTPI